MSKAPATTASKLAVLLASPATRLDVYRSVRRAFKGVKALCAATVSEYLIRAGVLGGYRPWTAQLETALQQKGWMIVGATRASPENRNGSSSAGDARVAPTLKFGYVCYSVDANGNGAPDHVFFFIRWLDRARLIAEVVDNYSPHPHPRNLGAPVWYRGKRLAYARFDHAQRLP